MRFADATIIITGAAGGLGSAMAQQAVKRRGVPADVANAVLFLSAPESSFITGQLLCVDGGWIMH